MKKILQLGTVFFGLMFIQNVNAADYGDSQGQYGYAGAGGCAQGQCGYGDQSAPADHPCEDQKTGDCWCLYCHYEPVCYTTTRCVQEQVPCKKKCTRMVPQYYEVQRCKYVPQYYTETLCKQVCECYEEDDCKTVTKQVCDKHVKYVPKYYWKHTCGDTQPCATQPEAGCCN